MGVEELAKIAEIIGGLGENASNAFMMYLGAGILVDVIGYSVGVVAIVFGYKAAVMVAKHVLAGIDVVQDMKEIRTILGVGCAGYITERERRAIVERVAKLVADSKAS